VRHLNLCLAGAAGAIVGLVAYDLAPSQHLLWGIGLSVATFVAVYAVSSFVFHPDDRDPTIRPSGVTKRRSDNTE